ncbi:MAG: ComF family protein [Cyclobacteriaceae bacterium]
MPETNYHSNPENELFQKFVYESKVKFASAYLFYHHKGIAQKLIHTMKYRNMPQIGSYLGLQYGRLLSDVNLTADFLIPVPIHRKRLESRGFNQSEVIAKGLSEALEIPVSEKSISRLSNNSTQTKKSKIERWSNVESIFKVLSPESIENKDIILVDDVLTTGATMGVLIDEVVKAGVNSIGIVSMAVGRY